MRRRTLIRASLAAVVVLASVALLVSWQQTPSDAVARAATEADVPPSERDPVVASRPNTTVVTTDPPGGSTGTAAIVAFTADGRTLYHDDTHGNYFDVDPDPPGSRTVVYVAGTRYDDCPDALAARENGSFDDGCAAVVIERTNLTTGETERLHTAVTDWDIWHDVDRIGEDRFLVADIAEDRVFTLNTTTDRVEWVWRAEEAFGPESGGQPGDWTHVNDVELLDDGRVMASLRNHDRVVFIDPGDGLQRDWTLGSENAYGVLYEQHNPDYIPAADGGPAVVVSDSENNRVVEYQRSGGEWRQSWVWQDSRLRWPRDADRLPSGHTLVTDSQGDRVLEVDDDGDVVWSIPVPTPYEAERLGTGDESAGGPSRQLLSNQTVEPGVSARPDEVAGLAWLGAFVVGPLANGLLYVAPGWMRFGDLVVALVLTGGVALWVLAELYWRRVHRRLLASVR